MLHMPGIAAQIDFCNDVAVLLQANKFQDPVTGEDVFMVIQTDVTSQVQAEKQLRQVLDAEHKLLEEIFPRQVSKRERASGVLARGPSVCMISCLK